MPAWGEEEAGPSWAWEWEEPLSRGEWAESRDRESQRPEAADAPE